MLEFELPWMFLLLPVPYLVWRFIPPYMERDNSVFAPFFSRLLALSGRRAGAVSVVRGRAKIQWLLIVCGWVLVVTALAEPIHLGALQTEKKSGRDLMVAVDLSGSMKSVDFMVKPGMPPIRRWDGLRQLMDRFAEKRDGDRLGLIVFGSGAYLQYPFSADIESWRMLLDELEVGMAGPATAIGDAIGLGIKAFAGSTTPSKMLLLITDGNDTSSRLPPLEAAKVAAVKKVAVYTITIGDIRKNSGENAVDSKVLSQVSSLTGGKSYIAADSDSLQKILADIDRLQPAKFEINSYRPKTPLARWLLIPVLLSTLGVWSILALRELRGLRRRHD